ncbi:MAG: glycoside hydrolase family 3 N-terminal domain-containing protein [bacterium]
MRMIKHLYRLIFILLLLLIAGCFSTEKNNQQQNNTAVYLDPSAGIEERVKDLLARMNLQKKIGQMTQVDRAFLQQEGDIISYGLGSILSGGGSAPSVNNAVSWADMVDDFQQQALQTRLKIPLIYGIDAVHGHNNVYGAVIFPHNIGLGCTRNTELVRQAASITAREVTGTGIHWTFSPCIAVVRDERWGRTYEGFGETPELSEDMAAAAVEGFQGTDLNDPATILACAKHFIGDGGTTGGVNTGNTELSESELRSIHLPGYIAAINSGVGSIMASFNSWNGEKIHGSHYLLTDVLKQELGFDGFIVSDWAAIDQLSGDYESNVKQAINAGIDMVMVPDKYITFINTLDTLVDQGHVSIERINDAVSRILRVKFQLGLFESPFTDRSFTSEIGSSAHRAVARKCVRQSLVLLKNEGNILPLTGSEKRIHVSGRNADDLGSQCGGWTISWQGDRGLITVGTTILHAIAQRVPDETQVSFTMDGSNAGGSDVGIAIIGEAPYAEGRGDRTDLSLSQEDIETVKQLKASGIPVVVILISGRPMLLNSILEDCDAIIAAWLPGTEGHGVADVLFGDFSPAGKLSHSWPRSMDQIPINQGDTQYNPLYPYGFGLTY